MTPVDPNHWSNFPAFYNHPMIMELAKNPRWTANSQSPDGKSKRPISVDIWRHEHKVVGCTNPDYPGTPSLTTLSEIQMLMDRVNHHAYRLHNPEDGVICLDVEKTCSEELKQKFLKIPYVYGEVSLSGRGYHLFLPYPEKLMQEFPVTQTKIQIKSPNNDFEFLINRHFVTFTRRMLPAAKPEISLDEFVDDVMRPLWAAQRETNVVRAVTADEDRPVIPQEDYIIKMLQVGSFKKTVADYGNDESKYDLAMARYYYNRFLDLVGQPTSTFGGAGYAYTDTDALWILSTLLNELRPGRNDAKGPRNGMPWLMYQTHYMLSSNERPTDEEIQLRWKNGGKPPRRKD